MILALITNFDRSSQEFKYVAVSLIGSTLLFLGCVSSKETVTQEQESRLRQLMNSDHLVFEAKYAFPQLTPAYVRGANSVMGRAGGSISQVNLTGQGYFLEISADSVVSYLPYFGEWDNFYDSEAAGSINLETDIRDYDIRSSKNSIAIKFAARRKSERLNLKLNIYPDGKARLHILSGLRDPIRFEGIVAEKKAE